MALPLFFAKRGLRKKFDFLVLKFWGSIAQNTLKAFCLKGFRTH